MEGGISWSRRTSIPPTGVPKFRLPNTLFWYIYIYTSFRLDICFSTPPGTQKSNIRGQSQICPQIIASGNDPCSTYPRNQKISERHSVSLQLIFSQLLHSNQLCFQLLLHMASPNQELPVSSQEASENFNNDNLASSDAPASNISGIAESPYNESPRYANTMGKNSAVPSPVDFHICDICVDTSCDSIFPPCCDMFGNIDYGDIPDLDLCDDNVTWFQRVEFCIFFEFGKFSKLCPWFCAPFDRVFGWSKVSDAVVDFFKLCGNPELFNIACIASCVPYFGLCYMIYIPLWLPCYACFALSQSFRKARSAMKSRTCRFITNGSYLLASGVGLSFRKFANKVCQGRTCFGCRQSCGPECAQIHRGGRYYTNYGLKNDGYEEYCFVCDQSWDSHSGEALSALLSRFFSCSHWLQDLCTILAPMAKGEVSPSGRTDLSGSYCHLSSSLLLFVQL